MIAPNEPSRTVVHTSTPPSELNWEDCGRTRTGSAPGRIAADVPANSGTEATRISVSQLGKNLDRSERAPLGEAGRRYRRSGTHRPYRRAKANERVAMTFS